MAILKPLENDDGTDSLSDFLVDLMEKHKKQESKYIAPLISVIENFQKYGSKINLQSSKNFPPFKVFKGEDFAELRTKLCRYFIYHTGNDIWIGLHGYEKHGNDTPKNEIDKAKREIKLWQEIQKRKK